MIKIGLTGSIGMGKSTTAQMFADQNIPVWDADAAVARLYSKDGAGVIEIQKIAPSAIVDERVNRDQLKTLIQRDRSLLDKLEQVVHPLVRADREAFVLEHSGAEFIVLDIPLLFENGTESDVDTVVVVTTTPENQKSRVLARGSMDEQTFEMILAKQTPDAEKRERADFVIETSTLEHARQQVKTILEQLRKT